MIHKAIKKHFLKFGLSKPVLQSINDRIMDSLDDEEELTDELIIDKAKEYEDLAKSFQSEVDARVQKAIEKAVKNKKPNTSNAQNPDEDDDGDEDDDLGSGAQGINKLTSMLQELKNEVQSLKKEKVSGSLKQQAAERLKSAKMTDKEIQAALFGREFADEEQLNEFVERQEELYEEVLKERIELNLGDGNRPKLGGRETSMESFKKDVEEFNKKN